MDELITIPVARVGEIAFEAFPDGVVVFRVTGPGEGANQAEVELTRGDLRGLTARLLEAEGGRGRPRQGRGLTTGEIQAGRVAEAGGINRPVTLVGG